MTVFNRIIKIFKGESYDIDEAIPASYVISFIAKIFFQLLWGIIKLRKVVFLHITSKIKCQNKLVNGKNLRIDRYCYLDALSVNGICFGKNCSVGKFTTIECTGSLRHIGKGLKVGNNVGLGTHGFFGCAGGVEIGSDTIFGNYVSIHSENHNYSDIDTPIRMQGVNRKGIKIGENCWIGAKSTILDGSIIGNGCIVAAGAVVRGVFPDNSIIGGVPAKIIKTRV